MFDDCTELLKGENGTAYDPANDDKEFARVDTAETPGYFSHLEHEWSELEVTKEATATENGLKERTCSICGEKETEEILATGEAHEHTCGKPTYTWSEDYSKCTAERVCSECNKKETETVNSTSTKSDGFYILYCRVYKSCF